MTGQGGWGGPPQGGWGGPQQGGPQQGGPWQGGPQPPGGQWPQPPGPYGAPPPYGYGAAPPARSSSTPVIIAIAVALVLAGGGAAAAITLARVRAENQSRSKAYEATLEKEKKEEADKEAADAREAAERAEKRATLEASVRAKMAVVDRVTSAPLPAAKPRAVVKRVDPRPVFYATAEDPNANAASEPVEHHLADPAGADPIYHSSELHACAAFAKGKKADITDLDLTMCQKLRYLAILRTKRVEARVVGKDRFISGSCTGDAVVFDLASGDLVASVPIAGRNSSEVTKYLEDASPAAYLRLDLDRACAWSAQSAINDAYAKGK